MLRLNSPFQCQFSAGHIFQSVVGFLIMRLYMYVFVDGVLTPALFVERGFPTLLYFMWALITIFIHVH